MGRGTLPVVRSLRICASALAAAGALAGPASAQVPGLTIDPESPSAKEYALPFENERRLADPETAPDAGIQQGQRTAPAFGAGITADGTEGGGASGAEGSDAGDGGGAGSGGEAGDGAAGAATADDGGSGTSGAGGTTDAGEEATVRAATANPGAPDGGVASVLTIGGVALAVLLVAGGAGLALRRRAG